MDQQQTETTTDLHTEGHATRRSFGKGALWVAPALTVMLLASAQPGKAVVAYPNGLPGT